MKIRAFYLNDEQKRWLEKDGYLCMEMVLPAKSFVIVKKQDGYFYKTWMPTARNLDRFTRLKRCIIN